MFKNEAAFSKALTAKLNRDNVQTQRIESHSTSNGIPDLFIQGWGYDCFIELKNDNSYSVGVEKIHVGWRPGQQAWAHNYYICHKNKVSLTVISCNDGFIIIPMNHIYKNDTVWMPRGITQDEIKHGVNLARILFAMSHIDTRKHDTYRDAIIAMVDDWYGDIDYDPDVLWGDNTIDDDYDMNVFLSLKLEMLIQLESIVKNIR